MIHDDVLSPVLNEDRATRSANPDGLTFITPKCRTATFQKSFMSSCARVRNVLPKELTAKNIGIACFKSRLYKYYESALKIYDVKNPRTWKCICLSSLSCIICPVICLVQIHVGINSNVCRCCCVVMLSSCPAEHLF